MGVAIADTITTASRRLYHGALDGDRLFHNEAAANFALRRNVRHQQREFFYLRAWLDYDRDGKWICLSPITLQWTAKGDLFCSLDGAAKSYCTPESYGHSSKLYHNLGDVSSRMSARRPASATRPANPWE